MENKRDVETVIGCLLCIVPKDEEKLRAQLETILKPSWYTPPELKRQTWFRIGDVFGARFPEGPGDSDWAAYAHAIIVDDRNGA